MMTIKKIAGCLLIAASVCVCGCHSNNQTAKAATQAQDTGVHMFTFPVQNGYGYYISVNGKSFIKQDYIPAIQGNHPFTTEEEAKKTGDYVVNKIRHQELPSLTIDEINKLGITLN